MLQVCRVSSFWLLIPALHGASITVCDEQQLRSAIAQGGTITFACDGTILFTDEIVVSKDTVLDGNGRNVVLNGGNSNRLFRIQPGISFALKKLTLRDGLSRGTNGAATQRGGSGLGGAIFNDGAALSVSGCGFLNNSAIGGSGGDGLLIDGQRGGGEGGAASGGAICSSNGSLFLADSVFISNVAQSGRGGNSVGIGIPGRTSGVASGGALWCERSRLVIQSCRFDDNRAVSGGPGSGYYSVRDVDISGGAILATNGDCKVSSTTFDRNSSVASLGGAAAGGAISHGAANIGLADCLFRSNRVVGGEGAFPRNISVHGGDGLGGAVLLMAEGNSVVNCTFVGNQAIGGERGDSFQPVPVVGMGKGGGINNKGTLTLINSTFVGNIAKTPDFYGVDALGGGLWSGGPALLSHVTMVSNSAECLEHSTNRFRGGAIYAQARARLRNTLLAHSLKGTNAAGLFEDETGNLSSDATPPLNTPERNNVDPKVNSLGDYGGPTPTVTLPAGKCCH